MNSEQIFALFNDIPDDYRMLVIDAAAVGCYLVGQGHEQAGRKLLRTAIMTAGLEISLIQELLDNLPESFDAMAMHAEIRDLVKKNSA